MGEGSISKGRCRCGEVRIRARGRPEAVVYCHCRDCRRSSGAPVSLFVGYRTEQVERRGEPKVYESSPGVRRSFCLECGSPISYEDERLPGKVYFHTGVFDEPEKFEPRAHSWFSQRLWWLDLRDDLLRYRESSVPR